MSIYMINNLTQYFFLVLSIELRAFALGLLNFKTESELPSGLKLTILLQPFRMLGLQLCITMFSSNHFFANFLQIIEIM